MYVGEIVRTLLLLSCFRYNYIISLRQIFSQVFLRFEHVVLLFLFVQCFSACCSYQEYSYIKTTCTGTQTKIGPILTYCIKYVRIRASEKLYSGTSLKQTLTGQKFLFALQRCPPWRGLN